MSAPERKPYMVVPLVSGFQVTTTSGLLVGVVGHLRDVDGLIAAFKAATQ